MARLRLSTDILSPLNSDISLNDASAFSFGSLPGTPVFESTFASPICRTSTKDIDTNLLSASSTKECDNAFDEITNNIKKQSSTSSEKEEKYKENYEDLKKSMDDLFRKNSSSSISSPPLRNKATSENLESKMHSEINAVDKLRSSENPILIEKNKCLNLANISETINKKSEKCKREKSATNKLKINQHQSSSSKQTSSVLESVKSTRNRSEAHGINDDLGIEKKNVLVNEKKSSTITSFENDTASFENKMASSKIMPKKKKAKGAENIKKYQFKCQKKISVPNDKPVIEHKSLSVEKSIQLTVSMEMENIRRFVIDQNLCMHKDLLKLQETVKKQNEVTGYLFSVIDELLDTNKKLISKYT